MVRSVIRRVALYLSLGVGWIIVSDLVVLGLHLGATASAVAQIVKGLGFIVFLGVLIYRGLVDLLGEIEAKNDALVEASLELVGRIGMLAEYRDDVTGGHNHRIGAYARLVAERLGLNRKRCELLELAAPLHDVGKIAIPDSVLLKPGPLDPDEMAIMRRHVEFGVRILRDGQHPVVQLAETVAHTHHERWDGSGYPQGLRGEQIPIEGRIVAVCDAYDAMVSDRPYKSARPHEEAVDEIRRLAGTAFDPRVVKAFLSCADEIERIHMDAAQWQPRSHWAEALPRV